MDRKSVALLKFGGVGVMATDTIYGLVASALNEKSVQRVYRIRRRAPDKPMIILISDLSEISKFGIKLSPEDTKILNKIWPNKVSVILPCESDKFAYLHRGTNGLAFRLPKKESVVKVLKKAGPLVAPSANPEGQPPAENIVQAKKYFGDEVDFYIDEGNLKSLPSTLVKLDNGRFSVLRKGAGGVLENL